MRRRGLDLVNNNPADIANGNPRIICGLIWQMILHFQVRKCLNSPDFLKKCSIEFKSMDIFYSFFLQIETNVQLLKEWGFELELANSPSTSRTGSGSSPFMKLPYQRCVGRLKAPVDRVVLRWVNAQLARYFKY